MRASSELAGGTDRNAATSESGLAERERTIVGLFDRLKRSRELARLRRRVRREPTPGSFGDLAERYIALGQTDDALRVAEKGLHVFPNSERLAQVRLFAKKKRLTGQIRRLRDDILRRPSPVAYTQLAEIYRELGSDDDALAMARECAERFPLNENPYLIEGEIRLERFLRDLIARDAELAEQALSKVVRLNAHNVRAHTLLAELFHVVGAMSECRKHLRSVLTIMPTARDVQTYLDGVEDLDDAPLPFDGAGLREWAEAVEEQGGFVNDPSDFPNEHPHLTGGPRRSRATLDQQGLAAEVLSLARHAGVLNAVVLDADDSVLAEHAVTGSLSGHQFAQLVAAVRTTSDDASRRMDTGALVRAEIEGPTGNVTVTRIRRNTVALLYDEPLRTDRAWELLQDAIARHTTVGREVARA